MTEAKPVAWTDAREVKSASMAGGHGLMFSLDTDMSIACGSVINLYSEADFLAMKERAEKAEAGLSSWINECHELNDEWAVKARSWGTEYEERIRKLETAYSEIHQRWLDGYAYDEDSEEDVSLAQRVGDRQ